MVCMMNVSYYDFEIIEKRKKRITVKAKTKTEAIEKIEKDYENFKIVFDEDDADDFLEIKEV